ncbi:MAG: caspase family protein [Planctomycetes bacterium]|nr:caspase family protein [Planctomycetota bacterium]
MWWSQSPACARRLAPAMGIALVCLCSAVHASDPSRIALLIGCSTFPNTNTIPALPGAANDVEAFEELLKDRFHFSRIITLSGWPSDGDKRPTRQNIEHAFSELLGTARAGSQVFILISGHGTQTPVSMSGDLLDPSNPEPDGLDEAFVPADFAGGDMLIRDNEFGGWFDQLRKKGAHVWVVFDCCFSGTMDRGQAEDGARRVQPEYVGVSLQSLAAAAARSRGATPKTSDAAVESTGILAVGGQKDSSNGSLVVFYACQSFQTARERVLPAGAEPRDENRHGVMSYLLALSLRSSPEALRYRDLGVQLTGRFVAELGSSGRTQTPWYDGDLDRQVFGEKEWPEAMPMILSRTGDQAIVRPGSLAGATEGATLAVFAPGDHRREAAIAHLQVVHATASSAAVEFRAHPRLPAKSILDVPDGAHCQVVAYDLGDHRVKLAVDRAGSGAGPLPASLRQPIDSALAGVKGMVELAAPEQAEWRLAVRSVNDAKRDFAVDLAEPSFLLLPYSPTDRRSAGDHTDGRPQREIGPIRPWCFASYPLSASAELAKGIESDLAKIARWNCLWRVAKDYGAGSPLAPEHRISVGVEHHPPGEAARPADASRLQAGDRLVVEVENRDLRRPYWYSLFFLSGNFGVQHVKSGQIRARVSTEGAISEVADRMTIKGNVRGTQGYVLIAVPQTDKHQPTFQFLAQKPIGTGLALPPSRSANPTPFQQLLFQVAEGSPARATMVADEPQAATFSWNLAP